MTYRNKSFPSPVTGSVAPIHHTAWGAAMDDSLKTFLNQSKKIDYFILNKLIFFSKIRYQKN